MDPTIPDRARESISQFCVEECKAYCCRKGYLLLKESQVDLVCNTQRKELEEKRFLKKTRDNLLSLSLANHTGSCPSLKDNICIIHNHPDRPQTCRKFPLFIVKDTFHLSKRCLAVKQGKLYPYEVMLLKEGLRQTGDPL